MTSKPVRVLHLRDSPWFDGPGRTIVETARQIDPDRVVLHVAAFCPAGKSDTPFAKCAAERGVELIPVEERSALDFRAVGQIVRLIDKLQIDVLHTHEFRSNLLGLICRMCRRVRMVSTAHGWIANTPRRRRIVALDKLLLRLYELVICVSRRVEEDLLAAGVAPGRITVVHNCLMLDQYDRSIRSGGFREEITVSPGATVIANIGRLSPEKGQADFLRCAKGVVDAGVNACFLLIGTGADEEALKRQAQELGIAHAVRFLGYRGDMNRIYRDIDVVVQSSYTEGLPNVILEALWMRVPVVATAVGGTSEIVEHDVSGLLVEPGAPQSLTDAILRVVRETGLRERLTVAGEDVIRLRFDFVQRTRRMMEIYESMAPQQVQHAPV